MAAIMLNRRKVLTVTEISAVRRHQLAKAPYLRGWRYRDDSAQ